MRLLQIFCVLLLVTIFLTVLAEARGKRRYYSEERESESEERRPRRRHRHHNGRGRSMFGGISSTNILGLGAARAPAGMKAMFAGNDRAAAQGAAPPPPSQINPDDPYYGQYGQYSPQAYQAAAAGAAAGWGWPGYYPPPGK